MYYFERIILLTLIVFLDKTMSHEKKSVHFKIHVPEIIKHHIHTKTVFIHVHEMKPEEHPKKHNEESHVEDWTSYNSYNYNNGLEENHAGGYHKKKLKKTVPPLEDYMPTKEGNYESYGPGAHPDSPDNLLSNGLLNNDNPLGLFGPHVDPEELMDPRNPDGGKMHVPPQYAIHEDVEEEIPEKENAYNNFQEHGYHRGMKTETGHVIHKNLKNFYDNENQEEDFDKGAYENENYDKYAKHGYEGNYDKEIGLEQRAGKKRADKRFIVAKMVIR